MADNRGELFRAYNWLFDVGLPQLPTLGAVKILSTVFRQTWGWQDERSTNGRKFEDVISHSQFVEKTGAAKSTVETGIQKCLQLGLMTRRQVRTDERFGGVPIYAYRCVLFSPWLPAITPNIRVSITPNIGVSITPNIGDTNQSFNQSKITDDDSPPASAGGGDAVASPCAKTEKNLFVLLRKMHVRERLARRLALDYENKPGQLVAWVRYMLNQDQTEIENPAGYLIRVLSDRQQAPTCLICGRRWRKPRTCAGCGGPLCYEHTKTLDDRSTWCTTCIQAARGSAAADDGGHQHNQDQGVDPAAAVVGGHQHGVGFSDNGAGGAHQDQGGGPSWVPCVGCGRQENKTYTFECHDCGGRLCPECARASRDAGRWRVCSTCAGVAVGG